MGIKDRQAEGRVIKEIILRSYVVYTPDGEFRRNRRHLIQLPGENDDKNGGNLILDNKSAGTEEKNLLTIMLPRREVMMSRRNSDRKLHSDC